MPIEILATIAYWIAPSRWSQARPAIPSTIAMTLPLILSEQNFAPRPQRRAITINP